MAQAPLSDVEQAFYHLGMMEGLSGMAKRFALGAVIGAGIVWALKPNVMFDPQGNPRPFAHTTTGAQADRAAAFQNPGGGSVSTSVPWLVGPLVGGLALSQLI
jgi:hypothetical protein